ncbi:MAG: hypothetical protein AB7O50_05530 [Pseudolabrys sp.]
MSSQIEMRDPGIAALPDDADIQALLARAVKLYAARADAGEAALPAFADGTQVTATEAVVAVTAILKAVNVQVFELGMWQAFNGQLAQGR